MKTFGAQYEDKSNVLSTFPDLVMRVWFAVAGAASAQAGELVVF